MTEAKPIRILVVDDHPVVREGLSSFLNIEPGMELAGVAADGLEAVQMAGSLQPDVILLDLVMPRMDGLEAIVKIREENPDTRIIVITSFAEDSQIFPAIKAGAMGYLLKDSPPEMLLQAIRNVHRGQSWLHPTIANKVLRELHQPSDLPPTKNPLTKREAEILRLVAKGLSNPEIAAKLYISEGTVRVHVSNIMSKLHLANRTQAALYALQEGLVSLD